jgi:hypothetical protein
MKASILKPPGILDSGRPGARAGIDRDAVAALGQHFLEGVILDGGGGNLLEEIDPDLLGHIAFVNLLLLRLRLRLEGLVFLAHDDDVDHQDQGQE